MFFCPANCWGKQVYKLVLQAYYYLYTYCHGPKLLVLGNLFK